MVFTKKIKEILEGLNQSGIAYDQQRGPNYGKYRPKDARNNISYTKGLIPTVQASKPGMVQPSLGIPDEEKKPKNKRLKKKKKSL